MRRPGSPLPLLQAVALALALTAAPGRNGALALSSPFEVRAQFQST